MESLPIDKFSSATEEVQKKVGLAWKTQTEDFYQTYQMTQHETRMSQEKSSDEPELEFSGSSRAKLWRFRAKLRHFNFRAETELKIFFQPFFPSFSY